MSTTLQAPRRVQSATALGSRVVTLTLAAVEGRRLLRNPLMAVGVALSVYLYVRGIAWGQMPVLPRDDVRIGYALLPLAAATLLATNATALRSRRHGTDELYDTLPTTPVQRTAAQLLSTAGPVGLAALLVAVDVVYLVLLGGIGTPNPFELATGPVVVALAGVLGVLLARLAPWIGVAPVMLIGLAALWYFPYLSYHLRQRVFTWHSFWAFPWFGTSGSEADGANVLVGGWHLAYAGGLVALMACLALARHQVQVRLRTAVATVLALALTSSGAVAQARPLTAAQLIEEAQFASGAPGTQVCETHGRVEYCAWPTHVAWINRWRQPIDGVMRRLPAAVARRGLRVRQMALGASELCSNRSACRQQVAVAFDRAIASSDVRTTSSWPRGSGVGGAELALAAAVGSWAVGLRTAPPRDEPPICMPPDQARVIVALWLAGQSTPGAAASLRRVVRVDEGAPALRPRLTLGPAAGTTQWPGPEAAYAVALLDRPAEEVAAQLQRDWVRLTSPGTPTAELVAAFGLQPLSSLGEPLAACPDRPGGER
ncbi:MAG: hypothetical protein ACRDYX_06680 [Egibacteraceae bacterium]